MRPIKNRWVTQQVHSDPERRATRTRAIVTKVLTAAALSVALAGLGAGVADGKPMERNHAKYCPDHQRLQSHLENLWRAPVQVRSRRRADHTGLQQLRPRGCGPHELGLLGDATCLSVTLTLEPQVLSVQSSPMNGLRGALPVTRR